ncbi:17357_t:CDS:2 [Dentiscutata erythropus]|uniref:17357_t:CDS:1 n=1 Tax=Dentiscutata erythropus TaxID=1348616 RepID=A0A9N9DA59_9GLOM|nr:17357_t:CDS:2 [Dentiscutata erythropus]
MQIADIGNKDKVLEELVEYVGKSEGFAKNQVAYKVLLIPATSAASEHNWSVYGFIHSKLHNRMLTQKAEKLVYIYWNTRILCKLGKPISVKNLQETCLNNQEEKSQSIVDNKEES